MKQPYFAEQAEVCESLATTAEGLSQAEAEVRAERDGKNRLQEPPKITLLQRFINQILDPMILILLAAAIVSGITAIVESHFPTDTIIILAVVLLNAVLGVIQESKAEQAIEALQKMSAATCKVLRDGQLRHIPNENLVVGDVVILEAGDAVPADARLLTTASMQVEESALTGESVPVHKNEAVLAESDSEIPLGDRANMVYMGTTVVYGRGTAVVTAIGMQTEMGKIADALNQAEASQTPLQRKLASLSRTLSFLVLGICVFIFAFRLLMSPDALSLDTFLSTFMVAVSLAVAAIPEGLAMVVTVVLSMGVTKLSKRNAIIRKLTAVETLGCAQIICSDKTGTLTQNKMTVVESVSANDDLLATAMALCSDAEVAENGAADGEPTECALVNFATSRQLHKPDLKAKAPRIGEAPFDSGRKMMSTVHRTESGIVQYTKGAPDEILARCTAYLAADGSVKVMDEAQRAEILAANKGMADRALRVLAAAYREYTAEPEAYTPAALENELIYIGLCGMIDPIRPEVKAAIEQCKSAGIRAVMITGDHKDTAVAIAKELGLLTEGTKAITGAELNQISDEELQATIEDYAVYARVQPEHKVRIVNAWRTRGKITAMTGDGVNDAPSIKNADIGVGMGITGTDVTKNVADMVLADDNFATIVGSVEEGRRIYSNIQKAIQFLLSSNMSEVLSVFLASILGFTILRPVHLLWINLITDSLPALALGTEDAEPDVMKKAPRPANEGVFAGGLGWDMLYQGILVTILTLSAYFIGRFDEGLSLIGGGECEHGMTMAFLTMSLAETFHSINMRSRRGSIFTMKKQNPVLWIAVAVSLVLTSTVLFVPFLRDAFSLITLDWYEYLISFGLAFAMIPLVEIVKFFQRKFGK